MGCVAPGGWLILDDGEANRVVRAAGGQCAQPEPDEPGGRCRLVSTHTYLRVVDGRRRWTACCPAHYRALVQQHGPEPAATNRQER